MKIIEIVLVVFYSAIFGGLLTVIIHRVPLMLIKKHKNFNLFFPASYCPQCNTPISWIYKLPILGYFISYGRCQSCKIRIPFVYILIEVGFTLLSVSLFIYYGASWKFVYLTLFTFIGIALFIIDMRNALLPDVLVFLLLATGLLAATQNIFIESSQAIIGCLAGFTIAYFIALIYRMLRRKEGLAFGDVKLLAALGAWFGPFSIPCILFQASILLLAYAGIHKIFIAADNKRKFLRLRIPFGPFLLLGSLPLFFFKNYISLFIFQGN